MAHRTLAALSTVLLIPAGLFAQRTSDVYPSVPVPSIQIQAPATPGKVAPAQLPPAVLPPTPITPPTPTQPFAPPLAPAPTATVVAAPAEAPAAEAPAAEAPAEEAKPEDKWFVEKLLATTPFGKRMGDNGWRFYGWTQGSYNASTANPSNLPVPFIDRARTFSLNQNWMHLEKTIDTSKKEMQWGLTLDAIVPGTDARFTYARGLFDQQNANGALYGFDIFQAYVDLYTPNVGPQGTTFRVGKFATFLEYEVVQGVSNPFISRSYLFQYNPFTHTGGLAITPINDNVTLTNGLVLGSDNFIDKTNQLAYLGQIKWAPKDGKTSVAFGTIVTDPSYNANQAFNNYNVYNLQVTHKFTDKLNYVLDASYSHENNIPGIGSTDWYGAVQYLFYDHTDKLQSKFRVELFEDTSGFRTGASGLYTAATCGVTWKPAPWLYVMPEVRYDNNSRSNAFNNGNDSNLFTAAIGFIARW